MVYVLLLYVPSLRSTTSRTSLLSFSQRVSDDLDKNCLSESRPPELVGLALLPIYRLNHDWPGKLLMIVTI